MGKKVVVLIDFLVRESGSMEKFRFLETDYGCSVAYVDVQKDILLIEQFQRFYLEMEKNGPDVFPANEELIEAMKDADIVISHISAVPSAAVNEAAKLKAACILRSGVENIDLGNATRHGVKVINTPGRLAVPVSEFTVGLILAEMKNIGRAYKRTSQGDFTQKFPNSSYSVNLKGKNIGIVGCGAVGSRVARILKAFEANVLVFDPFIDPKELADKGYEAVELNDLCRRADVILVHYRLTPQTAGLIGAEQFNLMKPTCFLINTARAGLVDEKALIDALSNHSIGGAALDVFHQEPLPKDHPFFHLDNVTMTPHLAGTCAEIFDITFDIMEKVLRTYFETGEWTNVVNP